MHTMQSRAGADAVSLLDRGAARAQKATGLPIAFGGLVAPGQQYFSISCLRGTATTSLANLRVRAGEGLGGKALALQRPAAVRAYPTARGITRRYDHAVQPEGLQSILSVPVALPGRAPVAVVYLALRQEADLGDQFRDRLRPVVSELAHGLEVAVEIEARMRKLSQEWAESPVDRMDLRGDLTTLMHLTSDAGTRDGLAALLSRLGVPSASDGTPVDSPLTRRETQTLAEAESGASNAEIATALGLRESTVKSYMKAALAKVGADNRVRACRVARERGWLTA